ncbi:MAG: hypothetical protein M3256_21055 [Actinomycetota bacterium]|nr:hypothetical protein [Actinomycetota bacterium]
MPVRLSSSTTTSTRPPATTTSAGDASGTTPTAGPGAAGLPDTSFRVQVAPGSSLARTGGDYHRLVLQASMMMAVGLVAVAASRTRRRERLAEFQQWLDAAEFADLFEFARRVSQPPRPPVRRWWR